MDHAVIHSLLDPLLQEGGGPSWHQELRRDLGIPENCAPDPLVCLNLVRQGVAMTPIAFVIEPSQLDNILTALESFLNEAFDPDMDRTGAVALVDYLPPMDELGTASGTARRWALDTGNRALLLPEIRRFLSVIGSRTCPL